MAILGGPNHKIALKELQVIKGCRKWIQGLKFEDFP